MNNILTLSKRSILLTRHLPVQTSVRTVLNNREWRPKEEIPVTPEDRAATAKKYNMLPEDYKPHPPEANFGDMPNIPPSGRYLDRSPWEDYDYPLERRNWNEPVHPSDHVKYDKSRLPHGKEKQPLMAKSLWKLLLFPITVLLGAYGVRSLELMTPTFRSKKPEPGVVHYSFEKDDGSGSGVRY